MPANEPLRTLEQKVDPANAALIVIGVATNVCVESCIRSAYVRDYYPVLPVDCTAARTAKFHDDAIETLRLHYSVITTAAEIERIWAH